MTNIFYDSTGWEQHPCCCNGAIQCCGELADWEVVGLSEQEAEGIKRENKHQVNPILVYTNVSGIGDLFQGVTS